ncbi:lipase/acyltransferase domain-containing protein [Krasilnikovia sp. MM14-A1259]|uniref:lipase/acyltransferase domain-containing protein n=1 Tax=Krasilnikovia sp. MM14-A1259 TaxID=3373539 RepID=UPI00380830CD
MATRKQLVVVLPGIGGSVLADRAGRIVWALEPGGLLGAGRDPGRLSLAENPDLRPVGLVRSLQLLPGWSVIRGYERLVEQMRRLPGTVVADGPSGTCPDANVVLFPYDFRRPVAHNAELLAQEVSQRLAHLGGNREHRVVVVAHSMGGLVARYWLGPLGGHRWCRALITLGTPHRGAPKALGMLVNGPPLGLLGAVTGVLREWPSVYELLPTYPAIFDPATCTSMQPAELPVPWLTAPARRAAETHAAIAAGWERMPRGLPEVEPRLGWSHGTPNAAFWENGRLRVTKEPPHWLDLTAWKHDKGDGTVPAFSALPPEMESHTSAFRREKQRHTPLASAGFVTELVESYERYGSRPLAPIRGDERPAALGLDLDTEHAAGRPIEFRASVEGIAEAPSTITAALRADHSVVQRVQLTADAAGGYRGEFGPVPPGFYDMQVTAAGLSGADRLTVDDTVAVVDE